MVKKELMKYLFFTLLITIYAPLFSQNKIIKKSLEPISYSEKIHNSIIKDDFRFLENEKDSTTIDWYKQNTINSENTLLKISNRSKLVERHKKFKESNTVTVTQVKISENGYYFYLKKEVTDYYKIFYRKNQEGKEILIFDQIEHNYGKDYIINFIQPNPNGDKLVISLSKNGNEISTMRILDLVSNKLLPEQINNCWPDIGGVTWLPDNKSFIYLHIPNVDKTSKEYLLNTESVIYKLGSHPKESKVLFSKLNNPELVINEEDFPLVEFRTFNSKKILIGRIHGARFFSDYYISEINCDKIKPKWQPFIKKEDEITNFEFKKDTIICLTSNGATNYCIRKSPFNFKNARVDITNSKILVKEDCKSVVTDLLQVNNELVYVKTKNGVEANLFYLKNNTEIKLTIPKKSGDIKLEPNPSNKNQFFITIKGWTNFSNRYFYDFSTNKFKNGEFYPRNEIKGISNIIVEEIEVPSYDGTLVPLSLIYNKGTVLNGKNRVLMEGYGAYGVNFNPGIDAYMLHWVVEGGIYVVAHVRGGGEKGENWHKDGYKTTKPNTWKDFISCSEYLIENKYTSPEYMAIKGSSAGGILIGRALTKRPDLFSAVIIKAGVLNPLRSEFGSNGLNNIKEFGTVSNLSEFNALLEMDSYQHVDKNKKYPALYLAAGMNDSRVPVWHSGKFVAKIRLNEINKNPVLFNVNFKGGHGMASNHKTSLDEVFDILSFAMWQTKHPDYKLID